MNSGYKNHHILKQRRLECLKASNSRCVVCGNKAHYTHHIDHTKHNHSLDNLMAVCAKCHVTFHKRKRSYPPKQYMKRGTKYSRLCGYTLVQLANKIDVTSGQIQKYLNPKGCGRKIYNEELKEKIRLGLDKIKSLWYTPLVS